MKDATQFEHVDFEELTEVVADRLALNQPVRRNLPGPGRLRMDRQLPFLCVYRRPPGGHDLGTRELVTTEAAYLFSVGDPVHHAGLSRLCTAIAVTMQEHFGTFLLIEIWTEDLMDGAEPGESLPRPGFRIVTRPADPLPSYVEQLQADLQTIQIGRQQAKVGLSFQEQVVPPHLRPLELAGEKSGKLYHHIGLAVHPFFRNRQTGALYPLILQALRRRLPQALRKTVAAFVENKEAEFIPHYHSLGPSRWSQAVNIADQQLCAIADSFDFVLQVTPVNAETAWHDFRRSGYERSPIFHYRPLPYDPALLKRNLFQIPLERIEDPTIAHLFWEKQQELDRQLSTLREIETRNFLYGTLQLYGNPDDTLVNVAQRLLEKSAAADANRHDESGHVDPHDDASANDEHHHDGWAGPGEVARQARQAINAYRRVHAGFDAVVEVSDHIASGMMVTQNRLLVSSSAGIPLSRLPPILHHEVGTHLLTYVNGRAQPVRQLYTGLAGYERLQEGLAVLSEYLTGGLTRGRLRTLAARVLAVHCLCDGAEFIETFRRLYGAFDVPALAAFRTTLRVYRGGGLPKDAIYLGGLRDVLRYLGRNHDIEPLYVGKMALRHVPFIQELRRRNVVQAPAILPHFLQHEELRQRLEDCRGATVEELCGETTP